MESITHALQSKHINDVSIATSDAVVFVFTIENKNYAIRCANPSRGMMQLSTPIIPRDITLINGECITDEQVRALEEPIFIKHLIIEQSMNNANVFNKIKELLFLLTFILRDNDSCSFHPIIIDLCFKYIEKHAVRQNWAQYNKCADHFALRVNNRCNIFTHAYSSRDIDNDDYEGEQYRPKMSMRNCSPPIIIQQPVESYQVIKMILNIIFLCKKQKIITSSIVKQIAHSTDYYPAIMSTYGLDLCDDWQTMFYVMYRLCYIQRAYGTISDSNAPYIIPLDVASHLKYYDHNKSPYFTLPAHFVISQHIPLLLNGSRRICTTEEFKKRLSVFTFGLINDAISDDIYIVGSAWLACACITPLEAYYTNSVPVSSSTIHLSIFFEYLYPSKKSLSTSVRKQDKVNNAKPSDIDIAVYAKTYDEFYSKVLITRDYIISNGGSGEMNHLYKNEAEEKNLQPTRYTIIGTHRDIDIFWIKHPIYKFIRTFHLPCVMGWYGKDGAFALADCTCALMSGVNLYINSRIDKYYGYVIVKYMLRGYTTVLKLDEIDSLCAIMHEYTNIHFNRSSITRTLNPADFHCAPEYGVRRGFTPMSNYIKCSSNNECKCLLIYSMYTKKITQFWTRDGAIKCPNTEDDN